MNPTVDITRNFYFYKNIKYFKAYSKISKFMTNLDRILKSRDITLNLYLST